MISILLDKLNFLGMTHQNILFGLV